MAAPREVRLHITGFDTGFIRGGGEQGSQIQVQIRVTGGKSPNGKPITNVGVSFKPSAGAGVGRYHEDGSTARVHVTLPVAEFVVFWSILQMEQPPTLVCISEVGAMKIDSFIIGSDGFELPQ